MQMRWKTALLATCSLLFLQAISTVEGMDDDHEDSSVVNNAGHIHYNFHGHEHDDFHDRPDSHAPAGLGADHTHGPGEWMVEYKFMYMNMQNMRNGTTQVTAQQARTAAGTVASPTDMNMMMHMGHIMRGMTDNVTLYMMFTWTENRMDHIAGGGSTPFRTENADFDDLVAGAVLKLYETSNSEWIGNIGFSFPTGDIDQVVSTGPPPPPGSLFPYPMRTGAGHVNIRPSITYKRWNDYGSLGIQAFGNLPLGGNNRGYSEGEEVQVSLWVSRLLTENSNASFRIEGFWRDDFDGADPRLATALVTTNRPDFQGRSNLNLYGGLNAVIRGHRLAIEVGTPVYQNVQGFQLEQDLFLFTSWSKAL